MSLATLMNRACTITHRQAGTVDSYGDETTDETTVTTVCELQQQRRSETTDPGTIADSSWLLILPADTALGAGDTVTVSGEAYEVHGEPWTARNPRTDAASHVEATVRKVEGTA